MTVLSLAVLLVRERRKLRRTQTSPICTHRAHTYRAMVCKWSLWCAAVYMKWVCSSSNRDFPTYSLTAMIWRHTIMVWRCCGQVQASTKQSSSGSLTSMTRRCLPPRSTSHSFVPVTYRTIWICAAGQLAHICGPYLPGHHLVQVA